jgi:hypothetical protein
VHGELGPLVAGHEDDRARLDVPPGSLRQLRMGAPYQHRITTSHLVDFITIIGNLIFDTTRAKTGNPRTIGDSFPRQYFMTSKNGLAPLVPPGWADHSGRIDKLPAIDPRQFRRIVPRIAAGWNIRVTSFDPEGKPRIVRNFLAYESDKEKAIELVRKRVPVNEGELAEAVVEVAGNNSSARGWGPAT